MGQNKKSLVKFWVPTYQGRRHLGSRAQKRSKVREDLLKRETGLIDGGEYRDLVRLSRKVMSRVDGMGCVRLRVKEGPLRTCAVFLVPGT